MKRYIIQSGKLKGNLTVPTSKSHTLRAILFASLASGKSIIRRYLSSPDTKAMIEACCQLGAIIERHQDYLIIQGVAGKPKVPDNIIDAGNSGQVLRFIGAIAGLISNYTVITGDSSVRHNRPVEPLLSGLQQLNALAESSRGDNLAPIIIRGPMRAGNLEIEGSDSQPVSGLLMACAFLPGESIIKVKQPGEKSWVALTLDWFKRLGIEVEHQDFAYYKIKGHSSYQGFNYTVPGDFSSLAFPIAAALITGSEITINPVDMNDVQGDKELISVLEQMGAEFIYDKTNLKLTVKACRQLKGRVVNINNFVDAVTILAVIGCYAQGETIITGAAIARQKECNRLLAICTELKKMGADIQETEDGLKIRSSKLKGTLVKSYHDHRMVMSLAVAGLMAEGETIINDIACVSKSFPGFCRSMQGIAMPIKEEEVNNGQ